MENIQGWLNLLCVNASWKNSDAGELQTMNKNCMQTSLYHLRTNQNSSYLLLGLIVIKSIQRTIQKSFSAWKHFLNVYKAFQRKNIIQGPSRPEHVLNHTCFAKLLLLASTVPFWWPLGVTIAGVGTADLTESFVVPDFIPIIGIPWVVPSVFGFTIIAGILFSAKNKRLLILETELY